MTQPLATIFIPLPPRVRGLLDLADTDADDEKIEASMLQAVKFRESLWKLSAYLASVIFGIHVIKGRNGTLIHPNLYWTGWPEISEAEVAPVLWYYTFQLAFYLASVGMLLAWEIRRRDAYVMMFHHLVSIAMMGTSIATG